MHATKAHRGSGGTPQLILNFGTRWKQVVIISHSYHLIRSKRVSGTYPIGGWVSHRTGLDIFEKRTISWSCLELNHNHPACSMVTTLTISKWDKPSTVALNMLHGFSHYSRPQLTPHFYKINFNIILQFTSVYYYQSLFPSVFPTKTLRRSFYFLCMHVNCPTNSSSLILMPKEYSVQSTNHDASYYAVFSSLFFPTS